MTFKKGWSQVAKANAEDNTSNNEFTSFKSGETLLVKFKSIDDIVAYYGYSMFGVVHTFVPEKPSTRDDNGYVIADATPWDLASQYHYDQMKKDKTNEKYYKDKGYAFSGKQRFMVGFYDVTTGEDIVVDFTSNQAEVLRETLLDYADVDDNGDFIEGGEHDFLDMVFKLSKRGQSTKTTVTLSPVVNVKKGLNDAERENLEKEAATAAFDHSKFEGILFEADEDEQKRGLMKAEFDLSLVGLTTPPPKEPTGENAGEEGEEEKAPEDDF